MGFFDFFKGKNKELKQKSGEKIVNSNFDNEYEYDFGYTDDNDVLIECKYCGKDNPKNYDIIILVVKDLNQDLSQFSKKVYNAKVGYFKNGKVSLFDEEAYEDINLGFSKENAKNLKYTNCLMTQLLDRDRVRDCLIDTFTNSGVHKGGDFVGSVEYSEKNKKFEVDFDSEIANYRHKQFEKDRDEFEKSIARGMALKEQKRREEMEKTEKIQKNNKITNLENNSMYLEEDDDNKDVDDDSER